MARGVVFDEAAAQRVYRAVRMVEAGDRDQQPLRFSVVQDAQRGKVFRMCTYTGAWSIDTRKAITLRAVTTTPNTIHAYNLFADLATPNPSPGVCAVAKDGTAWYLIAARCP